MCFSAGASFAAGAVISATGVATMRKARQPDHMLFAAIPFIFGLQQLSEGVIWLTLRSSGQDALQNAAAHIYLLGALVIWPLVIPLSMFLMERVRVRKWILAGLLAGGVTVAAYYSYRLILFSVTPQIEGMHIIYHNDFPNGFSDIIFPLYLAATILPLFISSVKRMWVLAVLILAAFIVSVFLFTQVLTSVWCFFAALASVVIYWILSNPDEKSVVPETG
ncbi:membrane protein [Dehalogenimonas sp. WBC-2]|nr:membrane protein [Dehalogenimonas sp. WBC-2]